MGALGAFFVLAFVLFLALLGLFGLLNQIVFTCPLGHAIWIESLGKGVKTDRILLRGRGFSLPWQEKRRFLPLTTFRVPFAFWFTSDETSFRISGVLHVRIKPEENTLREIVERYSFSYEQDMSAVLRRHTRIWLSQKYEGMAVERLSFDRWNLSREWETPLGESLERFGVFLESFLLLEMKDREQKPIALSSPFPRETSVVD